MITEFFRQKRIIISLIIAVLLIYQAIKIIKIRKGIPLKGVIAGHSKDNLGNIFAIVQFTYEGNEYNILSSIGHDKEKFLKGEEVDIYYDPKNHKYVHIAKEKGDIIWGGVGILFVIYLVYTELYA
ncbi:MAG: hypothetical protein GX275_11450 [Clostridiales bacterium]|nr:hypothetical protein [Clostridiales bacterium]